MKKNWIIIIIIFLLATNAALMSTLIIKNNKNDTVNIREQRPRLNSSARTSRFEQQIAEELNLDVQQKNQLKYLSEEFHQTRRKQFEEMGNLKKKYFTSLTEDYPEAKLKNFADSLGKVHAEMMLLDYQHYRNIRSICTKEQAQIFDSLGNKHISNKDFYRHRARYGRRHQHSGSRLNNGN